MLSPTLMTRSSGWRSCSHACARSASASTTNTAWLARISGSGSPPKVAAGYLTWRLREGADLREALEGCLRDLDGFYTFAVGTIDGFAVLRDPIACKPAVLAETDDWVAMASEYRAIAVLPGAQDAVTWEPAPGHVYSWGLAPVA